MNDRTTEYHPFNDPLSPPQPLCADCGLRADHPIHLEPVPPRSKPMRFDTLKALTAEFGMRFG